MTNGTLPEVGEIEQLLAEIDAIIGLGAAFPPSRFNLTPPDADSARYTELWHNVEGRLQGLRDRGFPFFHRNQHWSLAGLWAWCIGLGGSIGDARRRSRTLYARLIPELEALREILQNNRADAPIEVMRELRESLRRTNELFVVMALRPEVNQFFDNVVAPAAAAVGLDPFLIDRRDTEEPIGEAILSSIRRSLLVLCDLTFARPNCYFEAGYAKGAFRRVIFTARRDHNTREGATGDLKVHFDVDQWRITWWDAADFTPARAEVEERLGAVLAEVRGA